MKYINLSTMGVKGPELRLDCAAFGVPDNTDTAPIRITSEKIIGRALKDFTRRDGDS